MMLAFVPFLYAETHYRLPFLFNLLFKKEPEIIADLPFRITQNRKLPVLLLIKDAHRFPVKLLSVKIFIDAEQVLEKKLDCFVREKFKEWIFEVDVSDFTTGWHEIQVKITYQTNGRPKICFADNYRSTSHAPFRCFFAGQSLPQKENFYAGDLHAHSIFTDDQIEFGASLKTMKHMARAVELDFFCVTDHSYDLDDHPDNYLQNDPQFPKWHNFLEQVGRLNRNGSNPLIIPGEEVSVRNEKNQTVHMLILNNPRLIPGSGDSGERWLKNKSEFSIRQVLQKLNNSSLVLPAHPAQHVPLAQRLFINRGPWRKKDLLKNNFHGLQFINGGDAPTIQKAIKLWTSLLLKGRAVFPAAGNDAHGHFNRVREMALPFVNMREHQAHIFGRWRTVIYCVQKPQTAEQVLHCFQLGRLFVTNGPFIELIAFNKGQAVYMGQKTSQIDSLEIEILSNQETGFIEVLQVIGGYCSQKKERILWQKEFGGEALFRFSEKISLPFTTLPDYIRAQVKTESGMGLTNFIWIDH